MKILITNDDSYTAKGIHTLVEILRPYGEITVVAPKFHQSGMSMAVNLGFKPIAVKQLDRIPDWKGGNPGSERALTEGEQWWYVDATPSSCVKYAIDNIYYPEKPDVVVSGINHGSNYATAALYSGTIGAALEAALAGVRSIAVSLEAFSPDADFSAVKELFPAIFEKLMALPKARYGMLYNVNFPNLPAEKIKGIRIGRMGILQWVREFQGLNDEITEQRQDILKAFGVKQVPKPQLEEGEKVYVMVGDVVSDPTNDETCDFIQVGDGYISILPQNLDNTDYEELQRLKSQGLESDF